jgi:hypothetical protein
VLLSSARALRRWAWLLVAGMPAVGKTGGAQ